jgi:hypothetical protein
MLSAQAIAGGGGSAARSFAVERRQRFAMGGALKSGWIRQQWEPFSPPLSR